MKKFLIYLSSTVGVLILGLYLAFLFYLPKAVDLNAYKPMIQEIAKEQGKVDVDFQNLRIVTTPHLQAGVKVEDISVKLPDGSTFFSADAFQARISLPNLLLLTVKVPCVEVTSPRVYADIANGEQFKIVRVVEDILNEQTKKPQKVEAEPSTLPFDPSIIKIKVPNAKITDYKAVINDLKSGHSLTLEGEELVAGYNNGKTAKFRTSARVLSDDEQKITANINIKTFIPPAKPVDLEDDPAEKIEMPFVNPVLMYRDYDLKSDVNVKLRLRQDEDGMLSVKGFANVEDTSVKLSGLQLPPSHIKAKFNGDSADLDTDIYFAKAQNVNLKGNINYGKKPSADLSLVTSKIYFQDMLTLAKAFLDTLHIQNNLATMHAEGFWGAHAQIKTNFEKIKSKGGIVARGGSISNDSTGMIFDKINANLIFQDNHLRISNTGLNINGRALNVEGEVNPDSYTEIYVKSDKLPIPWLFKAFAPADLKKAFSLNSGDLTLSAKIKGELKKAIASAHFEVGNFDISDKNNSLKVNNESLVGGFVTDMRNLNGNIFNKNFKLLLPQTDSEIAVPQLRVRIDINGDFVTPILIEPSDIYLNKTSKITFNGKVGTSVLDLTADGNLNAEGLRKFLGRDAEPFIAAKGNLPIKVKIDGTNKKQSLVAQIKSDAENYITPVEIESMLGHNSILQAKIDYKGDRLNIKNTGFYTGVTNFGDDLEANMENVRSVVALHGTIARLNTVEPFINMFKVTIPTELKGKLTAFMKSNFTANGNLLVFGKVASPMMNGNFKLENLAIPELMTTMELANLDLTGQNIFLNIKNLLLNGSDINVDVKTDIIPRPVFTISSLDVNSKLINLDKMLKITEELPKYMAKPLPQSQQTAKAPADIPLVIKDGSIDLKRIQTGNIIATNTTGKISLKDNNFNLNRLRTTAFDGTITGDIVANIITMALDIKTQGSGLNVEKAVLALMNMKDMLSGTASFRTDINLSGTTLEEQMKSLAGTVSFAVVDGQLGPFGKLENMILAENIRESKFFQTTLGGVINSITTIDTSHFSLLDGYLSFEDGVVTIDPITTTGKVMSIHIAGTMDLLQNVADMKVRGKLGSFVSNMLGPIAQLNPINLVQVTPGLNVVMAQAFSFFCEQVTPEEMDALPILEGSDDDLATKFQVVLRGDVNKPFSLVKSFKWLALASDIEKAQGFVSTLPDPSIVADPENATIEAIMQAQAEKAKEDAKLKNKLIRFFKREK